MLIEQTNKFREKSEEAAKKKLEEIRESAKTQGYIVKKAGYEYKTKKSKGEIIGEVWVVSATLIYFDLWEEVE